MNKQVSFINNYRLGQQYRKNSCRYAEIRGIGWFVFVRETVRDDQEMNIPENMIGPFQSYLNAVHGFTNYMYLRETAQDERKQAQSLC